MTSKPTHHRGHKIDYSTQPPTASFYVVMSDAKLISPDFSTHEGAKRYLKETPGLPADARCFEYMHFL